MVERVRVVLTNALVPTVQLVDRATADARLADGTAAEYYLVPSTWPDAPVVLRVGFALKSAGGIEGAQRQSVQRRLKRPCSGTGFWRAANLNA